MLDFNFWEKDLGPVSPPHSVYDFSREMFLMLYSINWSNFIVWLPLLLEILGNMCITIVCYPGCEVITFESKPFFLIKPLLYDQKVKTKSLRAELAFEVKWKAFLLFLKGFQLPKVVLGWRVNL